MSNAEGNEASHEASHAAAAVGKLVAGAAVSHEKPTLKPNLYLALGNAPRDELGNVTPTDRQRAEIIRALAQFEGILPAESYDETKVASGVERARKLVDSGKSTDFLSRLLLVVNRSDLPEDGNQLRIQLNGELAVDPRRIVGVQGLQNWQGVAYNAQHMIITKQEEGESSGRSRPNYELIDDYATRPTQLPPANGIDLFLAPEGIFAYSHDSHRVAAAQLRGEPVRIKDVRLFDYRSKAVSPAVQRQLQYGLWVAETNSSVEYPE